MTGKCYRSAGTRMCRSPPSHRAFSSVIYFGAVDKSVVPGSGIYEGDSHGALNDRRMGDTDDRESDAARWSRLVHWLESSHGMDMSQLAVEARNVEGACIGRHVLYDQETNRLVKMLDVVSSLQGHARYVCIQAVSSDVSQKASSRIRTVAIYHPIHDT